MGVRWVGGSVGVKGRAGQGKHSGQSLRSRFWEGKRSCSRKRGQVRAKQKDCPPLPLNPNPHPDLTTFHTLVRTATWPLRCVPPARGTIATSPSLRGAARGSGTGGTAPSTPRQREGSCTPARSAGFGGFGVQRVKRMQGSRYSDNVSNPKHTHTHTHTYI